MSKITVIDLGMNNLLSICRALEYCGAEVEKTDDYKKIIKSNKVVLPGVGAFGEAMKNLNKLNLVKVLKNLAKDDVPILGICLGMQLFLESSEEFEKNNGLGLIPGKNVLLPTHKDRTNAKVPSIGWFELKMKENLSDNFSILTEANYKKFYYFVHSYHAEINNENYCLGYYDHGKTKVTAAIKKGSVVGFQFHPEKSGIDGLKILGQFVKL